MARNAFARVSAGVAGASLVTGLLLTAGAPAAEAAVVPGIGHNVSPAQPYKGNPDPSDWLGSYKVGDQFVWCVQYAYLAPDSGEQYRPGEALKTKWGTALPADVAADISYLLLRYRGTTSPDEAAALAHLLHSWTAAPQSPDQLNPARTFREIAYDAPYHLQRLPAAAQQAVTRLKADATANRGPWKTGVTAPTEGQVIGTPGKWTVDVRNAQGTGVAKVPLTLTLTDATVGGKAEVKVATKDDGSPAVVEVTPTGPNPKVAVTLLVPATSPKVHQTLTVDTQRVVSTGGEETQKAEKATKAVTAPGSAAVAKVDEKTGKGIPRVSLRVTGPDKTSPAVGQDGKPLVGADGAPVVVVTGEDGSAKVGNLRTPQQVCVVEVAAPPGYDDAFDPGAPPSVCGEVKPGDTLALKLANKPNAPTVPRTIPAGDDPVAAAAMGAGGGPSTGALVGLGALVLLATAAFGFLFTRAPRRRAAVSRAMRDDWGY